MSQTERRRFFRIDDSIKLSFRPLEAEEVEEQLDGDVPKSPIASLFGMDTRIKEMMSHYQSSNPELGELLGLINKKVDAVIELVAVESGLLHRIAYRLHQVNISACGIAFSCEENIPAGTLLGLDMLLSYDEQHLSALGRVVECEPLSSEGDGDTKQFFIRVDYQQINDVDQEMLIQYLVKRQLVLYRQEKELAE